MNALKKETIKDHIVLFKQKIYLLFSLFGVPLKTQDVATVCSLYCDIDGDTCSCSTSMTFRLTVVVLVNAIEIVLSTRILYLTLDSSVGRAEDCRGKCRYP